jgi:hypothetical protein
MKPYANPEAFKQALEARIRKAAPTNIGRFRQVLVFDRFLARVHTHFGERVIVKGGVVLELRLDRARATKDVDLRLTGDPKKVLADLQAAGRLDLADRLSFEIAEDRDHPVMQGEGMVYDGYRYRAEARLAGKIYASAFGVDVAFADAVTQEPEVIPGSDFLAFAGVDPTPLRVYPRATHIAEKLHAYTLPRDRQNTRVKDLPDIALLASMGPIGAGELREAIHATFAFRRTHGVPAVLPAPPGAWETPYTRMARLNGLPWPNLVDVEHVVRAFLDPVLDGSAGAQIWRATSATWS